MTVEPPVGPPLGFPGCPKCTYLGNGSPRTCLNCAAQTVESIGPNACPVCDQFIEDDQCPNWLCRDPRRRISRIRAISYLSGPLKTTIHRYKYDGRYGWASIFGRLLVAWLDQNARQRPPDLIVANPTYLGTGGAAYGHTELVIEAASTEDVLGEWQFDIADPRALIKACATPRSAASSAQAKRSVALDVRSALRLTDPERVRGQRILIYDDVCTTGSQLDAVADFLLSEGGATDVEGVVLARAPWRLRP